MLLVSARIVHIICNCSRIRVRLTALMSYNVTTILCTDIIAFTDRILYGCYNIIMIIFSWRYTVQHNGRPQRIWAAGAIRSCIPGSCGRQTCAQVSQVTRRRHRRDGGTGERSTTDEALVRRAGRTCDRWIECAANRRQSTEQTDRANASRYSCSCLLLLCAIIIIIWLQHTVLYYNTKPHETTLYTWFIIIRACKEMHYF